MIEELSTVDIDALPSGFWENFIQFGAGPLAAPVFIFAMGVGIVFQRHQEPIQLFKRGLKLWAAPVPEYLQRCDPSSYCQSDFRKLTPEWETLRYQLFNIDILHFAGLAFILTALFKRLRYLSWHLCYQDPYAGNL